MLIQGYPFYKMTKCACYEMIWLPSRVSCSFFTRMRIGSLMNFCVTSNTSAGIVAERRITCAIRQEKMKIPYTVNKPIRAGAGKLYENVLYSLESSAEGARALQAKPKTISSKQSDQNPVVKSVPSEFLDLLEFCWTCNGKHHRFDPWILWRAFHRLHPRRKSWWLWERRQELCHFEPGELIP